MWPKVTIQIQNRHLKNNKSNELIFNNLKMLQNSFSLVSFIGRWNIDSYETFFQFSQFMKFTAMRSLTSSPNQQVTKIDRKWSVSKLEMISLFYVLLSVSGHWKSWEAWSDCKVFPIDRSRKFSIRSRVCECDNCNRYCIGKHKERKICSCAYGYSIGENALLPCNPCTHVQSVGTNKGLKRASL